MSRRGNVFFFNWLCALPLLVTAGTAAQSRAEDLFVSRQLTPAEYTRGIEGPAVDRQGNLYVVNFGQNGTIGRLVPGAATSELFATLPAGSIGNGIRIAPDGRMYIADYKAHNILVIAPGSTEARVYFHSPEFNQPNDLAIAADGTLYASDPAFKTGTGRIWRIGLGEDGFGRGEVMTSDSSMGVTNGLDLSPDGKVLYVSMSNTREVWAYRLAGTRLIEARPIRRFDSVEGTELDGLRTDMDGRIFVTRPGAGSVTVLRSNGALVREIKTQGRSPSNLAFGGPDGKTVYVTQVDGGFVESFRTDRRGREFCLLRTKGGC